MSGGQSDDVKAAQIELAALEENREGEERKGEKQPSTSGILGTEHDDHEPRVYRKYESKVNSPESLQECEKGQRPDVKRQESIMRHVYVRMQEKDLNTVADNLAPKYLDISSSSGSRRRILRLDTVDETMDTMSPLPRKKTLGMDMAFSLRMTMSLAFSLLMGFGLLIMIVISSEFTQAILRNYEAGFEESLAQLVRGTAYIVNSNAERFGKTIVREFADEVDHTLIELPIHALADIWMYYRAQPITGDSFVGALFTQGLLNFTFMQMENFYFPIPNFYYAFDTNDVYGYSFPRVFQPDGLIVENKYFLYAQGEDSDSNTPYAAKLYSCPPDAPSSDDKLSNCSSSQEGVPYNTTQRPYYVIQSNLAFEEPSGGSAYVISDLYTFARFSEGYTVTWPISTCERYDCFEGVIGADVTTASASQLCNISLYNALFQLTGKTDLTKVSEPAAFYVMVRKNVDGLEDAELNQTGWLVGAALNNETFEGPLEHDGTFHDIFDPRAPLIAKSSSFLLENIGPFESDEYDSPQFLSFNNETVKNCSCVEVDHTFLDKDSFKCYTVATFPAGRYMGSQQVTLASEVSWLAVAVLPCGLFLQNLNATIADVEETIAAQGAASKDAQSQQLISAIAIAIVLLVGVVVVAILLSSWISHSLVNVQRSMQSLRKFEFHKNAIKQFSRTKEVADIQETFLALRRALYAFAKFVPSTVVKNIVKGGAYASKLHVQNKKVTILFSDIAGFTSIAEKLEINDLLYLLTSYLTVMTRIVENYEGVVAEILGDGKRFIVLPRVKHALFFVYQGLLVYWNTPDDVKDHAAKGLATALACQQTIKTSFNSTFQELLTRYGLDPIKVRIGVHTGVVLTGNMGSDKKMKFGCMGDPVNLASRLEGLCKLYGVEILCSEATLGNLPTRDTFYVRELDLVRVQGKAKPTKIFEVISQDSAVHNVFEGSLNSKNNMLHATDEGEDMGAAGDSAGPASVPKTTGKTRSIWRRGRVKQPRRASTGNVKKPSTRTEMIFQVQDAKVDSSFRLNVATYVESLHAFQAGDFDEAMKVIRRVADPDRACRYLTERIEEQQQNTKSTSTEAWTGVNVLGGKNF